MSKKERKKVIVRRGKMLIDRMNLPVAAATTIRIPSGASSQLSCFMLDGRQKVLTVFYEVCNYGFLVPHYHPERARAEQLRHAVHH